MEAVRAHFRPEFLNRLDEVIVFHRLSRKNMDGIVDIQLALLQKRLAGGDHARGRRRTRGPARQRAATTRSTGRGR